MKREHGGDVRISKATHKGSEDGVNVSSPCTMLCLRTIPAKKFWTDVSLCFPSTTRKISSPSSMTSASTIGGTQ